MWDVGGGNFPCGLSSLNAHVLVPHLQLAIQESKYPVKLGKWAVEGIFKVTHVCLSSQNEHI